MVIYVKYRAHRDNLRGSENAPSRAAGEITTTAEIEEPGLEIPALSWHDLVDFLEAGQAYE